MSLSPRRPTNRIFELEIAFVVVVAVLVVGGCGDDWLIDCFGVLLASCQAPFHEMYLIYSCWWTDA